MNHGASLLERELQPVVVLLRELGHDVLTVAETGKAGTAWSDAEVLAFAVGRERAVLTLNRKHFIQLHSVAPNHFGIVVCTLDVDFKRQASRIDAAIAEFTDLRGRLIRVNRPSS